MKYFDARLAEAADKEFGAIGLEVLAAKTYYTGPSIMQEIPTLGFKVRYRVTEGNGGYNDSVGMLHYLSDFDDLPTATIQKIADRLTLNSAKYMREHAEREINVRRPLPIKALTTEDRASLCLPF